jgi:hypothetical protein
MYELTVPRLTHMMKNLVGILQKAQAHCDTKKVDESVLPSSRLIADMLPLSKQIQITGDFSKGCVARLAGDKAPSFEDNETTLAQLIERLEKTIAYVSKFTPEQINNTEQKDITMEFPNRTMQFKGQNYVLGFVLPNVYFHITTAYNILRSNGVDIGKQDFVGSV